MKEHNNMIRWIIFAILFSWAIYALIPTYQTYFSSEKQTVEKIKIKSDLSKALAKQERGEDLTGLESNLIKTYGEKADYLSLAPEEIEKLAAFEKQNLKSLALGLDLQGGMHLVLEIDYDQLLKNKATKKDKQLEDILAAAKSRAGSDKEIYLAEVKTAFSEKNVPMNNYFGRSGESDEKILASLDSAAKKGITTTLEVLRNRIDQFGIAEPSIQPRGKHRIVVELPGVKDEERATKLVNQAAFLEFKIVADNEILQQKVNDIDIVLKNQNDYLESNAISTDSAAVSKAETPAVTEAKTDTSKATDATKLFSDSAADTTAAAATDEELSKNNPFKSLLVGGQRGEILVKGKNKLKVEELLKNDNVRNVLGNHEFVWKNKPDVYNNEEYYEILLVDKKASLDGTSIVEASANLAGDNSATGGWEVPFELNRDGGRVFAEVTGKNVGKRLAIILDNKLYMAPNIQVRIPNGRGVITLGGGTAEEARDMAIVLKAGALEAPLEIMEKRIIGPSLGSDAINSSVKASLVGSLLVVIFMIALYKLSGVFAVIALFLNTIFTLASLSYFKATLTLPGIAGIVLTIGMAVDANIIIFERIKEELGEKNTILSALNAGYDRAFVTIFDSNLTTFIAGITLYQFGTGPVRGFALTLMIGLIWNMYTAVVMTRLLTDLFMKKNAKSISI
ncbi:TPA: protein translocase subunit SecD [Candidatus Delongbacteria bacterium]|nr:MAG: protein-export membrane protein SecD [Candidatus Delongbacteria bacterium GWF2_40_14]HAQ61434.1 protein translocase subunit SecD [Candidatus Delongbacteria bacterium]